MELSTKPNITLNSVVPGFFSVAFRGFLRIKPPVCRLLFFAILTRCPLFIVATVRFRDRKWKQCHTWVSPLPQISLNRQIPVFYLDNFIRFLCQAFAVRYDDHAFSKFMRCSLQQRDDFIRSCFVQVSGGFICQQYFRITGQSSGNGYTLLLSTG